jgi:hypothetical protein
MNSQRYEELLTYADSIQGFKALVMSESKCSVGIKALCHVSGIDERESKEFVREYYSRMDIKLVAPRVLFNEYSKS